MSRRQVAIVHAEMSNDGCELLEAEGTQQRGQEGTERSEHRQCSVRDAHRIQNPKSGIKHAVGDTRARMGWCAKVSRSGPPSFTN